MNTIRAKLAAALVALANKITPLGGPGPWKPGK